MSYKNTPDAWKMDGLELSVEQKLNDVYDIASTAAAGALPSVSSADNGKALLVKSGKWQKAAIPSQLPTVTSDDNGDVLTVVEGAWAKAAASGGSDIFELKFTATPSDDAYAVTANKTYAELSAALQAGKTIIANLYFPDVCYNCATYSPAPNSVEFVFLNLFYYDSQLDVYDITFRADSISLETAYFPLTPAE